LTNSTSRDIIADISGHGRPPIISVEKFKGFKMSGMSSGDMVMMKFQKIFASSWGDVSAIAEVEDSIGDLPIAKFGSWWR